jgi:hypothetical protein
MSERKFKGVYYRKERDHWVARIVFNNKRIYIGSYKTEQEAMDAYEEKSLELYEFDRVNDVTPNPERGLEK